MYLGPSRDGDVQACLIMMLDGRHLEPMNPVWFIEDVVAEIAKELICRVLLESNGSFPEQGKLYRTRRC